MFGLIMVGMEVTNTLEILSLKNPDRTVNLASIAHQKKHVETPTFCLFWGDPEEAESIINTREMKRSVAVEEVQAAF